MTVNLNGRCQVRFSIDGICLGDSARSIRESRGQIPEGLSFSREARVKSIRGRSCVVGEVSLQEGTPLSLVYESLGMPDVSIEDWAASGIRPPESAGSYMMSYSFGWCILNVYSDDQMKCTLFSLGIPDREVPD